MNARTKSDIFAVLTGFFVSFAIVFGVASCAAARPEVKSDFSKRQAIGVKTLRPEGGVATLRQGGAAQVSRAPGNNNITATLVTKGAKLSITINVLSNSPGDPGSREPAVELVRIAPGVFSRYLDEGNGIVVETWITTKAGATRFVQGAVGGSGFSLEETWVTVTRTAGK